MVLALLIFFRRIQSLRALLLCFEIVSGLRVNLSKFELVLVGVVLEVENFTSFLGCKVSSFLLEEVVSIKKW